MKARGPEKVPDEILKIEAKQFSSQHFGITFIDFFFNNFFYLYFSFSIISVMK